MVMGLSYLTCPWCPWSLSYSGCLLDLHVTSLILLLRIRMTWKTYRSEPGASQDRYMASWTKQLTRKQIHRPDRSLLDLSRQPRELKVEVVVACWPGVPTWGRSLLGAIPARVIDGARDCWSGAARSRPGGVRPRSGGLENVSPEVAWSMVCGTPRDAGPGRASDSLEMSAQA
jgi:hypothetical protein